MSHAGCSLRLTLLSVLVLSFASLTCRQCLPLASWGRRVLGIRAVVSVSHTTRAACRVHSRVGLLKGLAVCAGVTGAEPAAKESSGLEPGKDPSCLGQGRMLSRVSPRIHADFQTGCL